MDTITELVTRAKAGDTAAFAEVYDLFADRIFRYIRLKVQDQAQAEDILQDVFIKAWRGLASLKMDNLNFSAWLYKVTGNTIADFFRKQYRTPQVSNELDDTLDAAAAETPNLELVREQDREALHAAIASLPAQYRQVLELRFVQDFTLQETADIMEKSNLAVRLLQHRALKQLKKILTADVLEYQKI